MINSEKKKKKNPLDELFQKNDKILPKSSEKDSSGKKLIFRMKMGEVLEPHFFIRNKHALTRKEANKLKFIGNNMINPSGMSQV